MRRRLSIIACLLACLWLSVPAMAAEVAQGKCVKFNQATKTLVIDEYDVNITPEHKYGTPTGKQLTFDVAQALIGITPVPGDIVRIAYDPKSSDMKAYRVMNVSKQDLRKK